MSHNHVGRITLILIILAAALWLIFPVGTSGRMPNLKPGIDMAGGTSLLYEIKPPEGGAVDPQLAEKVMESLKKRVDPQGVRNLIWRPEGADRIEILMPSSGHQAQNQAIQEAFLKAQSELERTNVRPAVVKNAVENMSGAERTSALSSLAGGSPQRQKLFDELVEAYQRVTAARQQQNPQAQAQAELDYEKLQAQIEDTNLSPSTLQGILDLKPENRAARLADLRDTFAQFPARLKAIEDFTTRYDAYRPVRGNIDDVAELKRLLKGSGVLEFHILVTDLNTPEVQAMIQRLHQKGPAPQSGDTMRWYQVDRPEEFHGFHAEQYNDKLWVLAYDTPEKSMVHRPGSASWGLQQAYPTRAEGGLIAEKAVGFDFDSLGARLFGNLTRDNVGQPLAIVLDNRVISAPNIKDAITGGRGTITGGGQSGFTDQELNYLISTLNAGSLPAQLADQPIREQTVSPLLGRDNLMAGLWSCIIGLALVGLFMIAYYHFSGIVAIVALLMNVILILGVMALLDATFTLPAVAGIVLTIGIAVDANVLVFERLREEQERGLSLRMALHNAYDRAWSAIFDSNVTTLITCAILYYFGTEEVKGFALTLAIGLLSSLFTALFVTRTIFGVCLDKFRLKKLGSMPIMFPRFGKFLHPSIDWIGKVRYFLAISAILLISGMVCLVLGWRRGNMLDVEFAAGTSVQFTLKPTQPGQQPLDRAHLEALLKRDPVLAGANVVSVGEGQNEYQVVTPNVDTAAVRDAIVRDLQDRLQAERESTFAMANEPVTLATGQAVVPIEQSTTTVAGYQPTNLGSYQGGAAIVLRNLTPPLTLKEIHDRVQRQMLQPTADGSAMPYRDFDVQSPQTGNPAEPVSMAVILVSDPNLNYSADPGKWRDDLAAPMWRIINDAITRPAQLSGVTGFNPQVAGDMQRDAILAIVLSSLAIMAYIWLRFGDLRYGTATIVATVHDTLMVVGFVGISQFLGHTAIGQALLIEPFRINLTLVAAVLTVMGYSMVDTIVVFDRIRENRGKFGYLSRQIINDSINQTLSRTLLTGGTTLMTVFVMYVLGGPAIHGFTFVMLIGILVGTYSSIAIASPILLLRGAAERGAAGAATGRPVGRLQRIGS